jgi:hypothetical protein
MEVRVCLPWHNHTACCVPNLPSLASPLPPPFLCVHTHLHALSRQLNGHGNVQHNPPSALPSCWPSAHQRPCTPVPAAGAACGVPASGAVCSCRALQLLLNNTSCISNACAGCKGWPFSRLLLVLSLVLSLSYFTPSCCGGEHSAPMGRLLRLRKAVTALQHCRPTSSAQEHEQGITR